MMLLVTDLVAEELVDRGFSHHATRLSRLPSYHTKDQYKANVVDYSMRMIRTLVLKEATSVWRLTKDDAINLMLVKDPMARQLYVSQLIATQVEKDYASVY